MFLLTVGIFSIIIVLIIISYSIIFCKIKPIDTLVTVADHIAAGDFTRKVELSSKDELGKLATHFNHFIDTVSSVLRESKGAIYDTMNQNSELASTMGQLAGTFQTQTGQVATVASAMEEMSASSAEVNNNIREAADNVDKAMDLTKESGQQLSEIMTQMSIIREKTGRLADTIQNLGLASDQIGDILKVINDIADQTNLLALNAAIEAARAGEAGRGFAVVADEVRKLAERTQQSTGEVIQIIGTLQNASKNATQEMNDAETSIQSGVEIIESTQGSFSIVVESSISANSNVTQVQTAISEQVEAIAAVNDSVQSIAAGLEESVNMVSHVSETTSNMHSRAEQAYKAIDFFKV
jgi:methyl-accepting chemotaxis protein